MRHLFALVAFSGLAFGQAAHSIARGNPQQVQLVNARYVQLDSKTMVIDPAVPFVIGRVGAWKSEFDFQSDIIEPSGKYLCPTMQVQWKIEDDQGRYRVVLGDGSAPEHKWIGRIHTVDVAVLAFNNGTGVGTASLHLPVGQIVKSQDFRYPHLLGGNISITVAVGWEGSLEIGSSGEPENVLCTGSYSLVSTWPDVWIGDQGTMPIDVRNSNVTFALRLDQIPSQSRTFSIECVPSGHVSVMNSNITFDALADPFVFVNVHPEDPGLFKLQVLEAGEVVAESESLRSVQTQGIFEIQIGQMKYTSPGPTNPKGDDGLFRRCTPAFCTPDPDTGSTDRSSCRGCNAGTAPDDCPGQDGGHVVFISEGDCNFGLSTCYYDMIHLQCDDAYEYSHTTHKVCGSTSGSISYAPGGIGPSGSATITLYETCCFYTHLGVGGTTTESVTSCH